MSSDHSDAIKVSPEELYEPSAAVKVGDVEEVHPKDIVKDDSKEEKKVQKAPFAKAMTNPVTHETPNVKTTYDAKDDATKPSIKSKILGKIEALEDKLRPKEAVEGKKADPHPNLV